MEVQVLFRAPIILITFFIHISILKAEVHLIQNKNTYSLKANECSELQKEAKQFQLLKNRFDHELVTLNIDCEKLDLNLTPFIPNSMLHLLDNNTGYYGPNCWNSILVVNNILTAIRYSKPEEIDFAFKNSCKKLNSVSDLMPGDVIRVKDLDSEDIHSFIYISPLISFSKDGPEARFAYKIETTNEVLKNYGLNQNCFHPNQKIESDCMKNLEFYNCSEKSKDLSKNEELLGLYKLVEELEKNMGILLENYKKLNDFGKRNLMVKMLMQQQKALLFIVKESLNENDNSKNNSDTQDVQWLYLRLDSIGEQLSYF